MRQANDNTAATKAIIYQFYVALDKCFDLKDGQKIIIEKFGDVTVSRLMQIETKLYNDKLSDSHINFWKTLYNWMRPEFDHSMYSHLILMTSQEIADGCIFEKWNDLTVDQKLKELINIHEELAKAHIAKKAAKGDDYKPSEVIVKQKAILINTNSSKLREVLGMFVIASASEDRLGIYQRLHDKYKSFVLKDRCAEFLNGLLGFIISPEAIDGTSWEITKSKFDEKLGHLIDMCRKGTRVFPTRFRNNKITPQEEAESLEKLFINKIKDIQYLDVLPQALMDYSYVTKTVIEDFSTYEVDPGHYDTYKEDVKQIFVPRYRMKNRNAKDIIKDSQNFYDEITSSDPLPFSGFDAPNINFRNGVLHVLCDDAELDMKWRVHVA